MKILENTKRKTTFSVFVLATLIAIGFVCSAFWPNSDVGSVKVVFSHFENVPGGRVAMFKVSNSGRRAVTLFGYNKMWPDYLVGWYDGKNWDLHYSPGVEFRLTGPLVLAPGGETAMPTFLPPLAHWVVGVQYTTANYARMLPAWVRRFGVVESFVKERMRMSWSNPSNPLTRDTEPSNIVAPLGAKTNLITVRFKDDCGSLELTDREMGKQ